MKIGERSINFSDEVKNMSLTKFTKYWKSSGLDKRTGEKAEDVHKQFKANSEKE